MSIYLRNAEFEDLSSLRAHNFLNSKSTLLKLLPPTEDAFLQHVKRAAYATILDKCAHVPKPVIPSFESYGWALKYPTFMARRHNFEFHLYIYI